MCELSPVSMSLFLETREENFSAEQDNIKN